MQSGNPHPGQTVAHGPGQALEQVLDRMHHAVLGGDLAILVGMGDEIESLLGQISHLDDPSFSRRMLKKATRNSLCLQAAARGVRAARRRFIEIHAAHSGLVTYDEKGQRAHMPQTEGRLTRRL